MLSSKAVMVERDRFPQSLSSSAPERFQPFVRYDRYGVMGMAPQSAFETARFAIAFVTLLPARLVSIVSILLAFYVLCCVLPDGSKLRRR